MDSRGNKVLSEIKDWIENIENSKFLDGKVKMEYHLKVNEDIPEFKADLYIPLKHTKIFIEMESFGGNIDGNVTKYWFWMENNIPTQKVVLIQIVDPQSTTERTKRNWRSRTELSKFIGRKIEEAFLKKFKFVFLAEVEGNWEEEIKKKIIGEVKKEF